MSSRLGLQTKLQRISKGGNYEGNKMRPDDMPINSTRDDKPSVDYSVLGRLDKIASKLIAVEAKLDTLLAKKKPKLRTSKNQYSDGFEDCWRQYPKRVGNNPKNKAFSAYCKRRTEGVLGVAMELAAVAYCEFCDATIEDKQYVMMASTFYGCQRPYEQDWTIPTQAESLPKSDGELVAWSEGKGFRSPSPGESFTQYRQAVTALYRSNP